MKRIVYLTSFVFMALLTLSFVNEAFSDEVEFVEHNAAGEIISTDFSSDNPTITIQYTSTDVNFVKNEDKQIKSGLAARWEIIGISTIRFFLRPNSKWSDGSLVTAHDVKSSLERAKLVHGDTLKSLFDHIKKIKIDLLGLAGCLRSFNGRIKPFDNALLICS